MLLRAFAAVPSLDVLCQFHRRRFRLLHLDMDHAVEPVAFIGDFAASSDEVSLALAFHLPGGLIPLRFCVCDLTGLVLLKEIGELIFIRQAKGLSCRWESIARLAGHFHLDGYFPEALPDIGLRERRPRIAQAKKTDEGGTDLMYPFVSSSHNNSITILTVDR
jgi:hypothetical protein